VPAASISQRRLEEVAVSDRQLRPYAMLLGLALDAGADSCWTAAAKPAADGALARLRQGQAALQGVTLSAPKDELERLYARLRAALPSETGPDGGADWRALRERPDLALLEQTINLGPAASEGPLEAVLGLTLLPLLQAVAAGCAPLLQQASWGAGCCPVCGAWPALAEARGLERTRVLRCGRCGAGWSLPWQLCPFCANDRHDTLGYLYDEEHGESRRVFTCQRCHGFLKTLSTLAAIEPPLVPVEDLATLTLDLAALDRGCQRPNQPGLDLGIELRWSGR